MRSISVLLMCTSACLMVLFGACKDSPAPWKKRASLYQKIAKGQQKDNIDKLSSKQLAAISKDFVKVSWTYPKRSFFVAKRWKHIGSIRCALCHLPKIPKRLLVKIKSSHPKHVLKHGPKGFHQCNKCHDPKKMDFLRTPTGRYVPFDQSYLVCSTCHVKQASDWAGGSHGKRLSKWNDVRKIQSCTGCHNPHAPKIGKTLPRMYERSKKKNARKEKKS